MSACWCPIEILSSSSFQFNYTPFMNSSMIIIFTCCSCLCELAKQIGFQSSARNVFSLKDQLFIFRHVSKLVSSIRTSKRFHLTKENVSFHLCYSKRIHQAEKTGWPVACRFPNLSFLSPIWSVFVFKNRTLVAFNCLRKEQVKFCWTPASIIGTAWTSAHWH